MSFFPSPDPAKLRAAWRDDLTTAPSPLPHSVRRPIAYRTGPGWPSVHGPSDDASWASGVPQGIGLPSSAAPFHHTTTSTAASMRTADKWPSSSIHTTDMVRKDSTLGFCDPLSTLLPISAPQEPLQAPPGCTILPSYETSPGRSEYSTSSQPSLVSSSPYTNSEVAYRTGGSPFIKLEDTSDEPQIHSLAGNVPFYHSMLVNPGDIYTSPPLPSSERKVTNPMHAAHYDHEDTSALDYGQYLCEQSEQALQHSSNHHGGGGGDGGDDRFRRGYTTSANSTCSCHICGKLFQRSYNLKAHMETHVPNREQPHACQHPGCERRFVRRTDLLRHELSVHLKTRNYPCHMCESTFARRDTLRRHIDDGCPRREKVRGSASKARRKSNTPISRHGSVSIR